MGVTVKKVAWTVGLVLCSASSLAADYGIGVSAKSDDAWVYVPIDVTPRIRIEPAIRFASGESRNTYNYEEGFFFPTSETVSSESDQMELSIGLFGKSQLMESARVYYGMRAAYIDGEGETTSTAEYDLPRTVVNSNRQSFDGYRVAPTLGFEYSFTEHFSLGAEVAWFYLNVDGDSATRTVEGDEELSATTSGFEQESNGTDTYVILRYRF
jgi:hypothetical protein